MSQQLVEAVQQITQEFLPHVGLPHLQLTTGEIEQDQDSLIAADLLEDKGFPEQAHFLRHRLPSAKVIEARETTRETARERLTVTHIDMHLSAYFSIDDREVMNLRGATLRGVVDLVRERQAMALLDMADLMDSLSQQIRQALHAKV